MQRIKRRRSIIIVQPAAALATGHHQPHGGVAFATVAVMDGIGKQLLDNQLHAQLAVRANTSGLRLSTEVIEQIGQRGKARRNGDFVGRIGHDDEEGE